MKNKKIIFFIIISFIMFLSFIIINNTNFLKLKGNVNYTNNYKNNYIDITQTNGNNFYNNELNFTTKSDDIKLITITANKPINEALEYVEIILEEGINFITYPVKPRENDTVYTQVEKEIVENDSLFGVIDYSDSSKVTKQVRNNMPGNSGFEKSTYGTLKYNIKAGLEEVIIPINIGIDFFKYYFVDVNTPVEIKDALKVRINGKSEYELSLDFKITNPIQDNVPIYRRTVYKPGGNAYTSQLFYSTEEHTSYGHTKGASYLIFDSKVSMNFMPDFKFAEYTLYYPKYTEFVDITNNLNNSFTNINKDNSDAQILARHGIYSNEYCKVVSATFFEENKNKDEPYCYVVDYNNNNNSNHNYVKVYVSKYTNSLSTALAVKYKVLTSDEIKEITNNVTYPINWVSPNADKVKITHYDNKTYTYEFNYNYDHLDKLTIYDPTTFENKVTALVSERTIYDGDDVYAFAPTFAPQNNTAGEKTNQMFEFIIPEDYEAFKANFAVPTESKILSVNYTICNKNDNKCETRDYKTNGNHTGSFKIDTRSIKGNLFEDYYFTNVKIKVDKIPEGYKSSNGASAAYSMSTVFGTSKKGKNLSVEFKIYDANNPSVYNSYIGKVNNISKEKRVGLFNDSVKFYGTNNIDNSQRKEITSIKGGEKFVIYGYMGPSSFPYSTLLNIYDTIIYLRQPKGLSLELDNLTLDRCDHRFDIANCTPIVFDKDSIEIIERKDDILYKIKTKTDIGIGLTRTDMIDTKIWTIRIKATYFVNDDFKPTITNVFNVSDLVTITGKPLPNSENHDILFYHNAPDTFDVDNNPATDKVGKVGVTNITVSPKSGFIVSSSIIKNNVEYIKYNENNSSSFVDVFTGNNKESVDEFSHKISIINNTEDFIKEGTKLYIPIAKKDYKYYYDYEGEKKYIQDEVFNWTSNFESIELSDNYKVYIATLKNSKDVDIKSLSYTLLKENIKKEDIAVVMIETTKSIPANGILDILVNQKPSDDESNVHLSDNIYKPIYDIDSTSYKGTIEGNKVGLKLYRPIISLDLYHDVNADNNKEFDESYILDDRIVVELLDSKSNVIKNAIKISNNYSYYVDNTKLKPQKYSIRIKLNDSEFNFLNNNSKEYIINNIDISSTNAIYKLEQGLIKYNLNFIVPEKIQLYLGEVKKVKISDIIPEYFNLVQNQNPIELEYENSYLNVKLNKYELEISSNIKKIEKIENKDIKITLKDKYGNFVTKVLKVELLQKIPPALNVQDKEIKIGEIIEFDKYVTAKNWAGNVIEIKLDDGKSANSNTFYNTNAGYIKDAKGNYRATKEGKYKIEYLVIEKVFGSNTVEDCINNYMDDNICLASKGTMTLNVMSTHLVSTIDNISLYITIFVASIVGLLFSIIIIIKNKKNR